jgi:hypothetical protein
MTEPMANRLVNAPSSAAVLSGKDIGSIKATSRAPNTKPAIKPRITFDMRRFSALALRLQHLVRIRTVNAILGQNPHQKISVKNYM